MIRGRRPIECLLVACALAVLPRAASAYTIGSVMTTDCHERMTAEALRTTRNDCTSAQPLAISDDEKALVDDLQFTPAPDMRDLGGATLLVAVRDNDLKGRSSSDLAHLPGVHGDPDAQQEHCLRTPDQDEPGGSAAAIAACRAFVRGRILEALDGLDAAGNPDPAKRTVLRVHLAVRGSIDARLPTYYVKMGQAIHAVEDSFSHTYRTPDQLKITAIVNWIDKADGRFEPSRDGPPHVSELDACDDVDPTKTAKHTTATAAATALLEATLKTGTPEEKMARVDALLDHYLTYSPGCTFANEWCSASERAYTDAPACGCRVGPIGRGTGALVCGGLVALAALARRRRRAAVGAIVASGILVATSSARAQTSQPAETTTSVPTTAPATAPSVPPPTVVREPGPRNPNAIAFGGFAGGSGAFNNPGFAAAAGVRLRVNRHWVFGLDGEWNPWIAFQNSGVKAGVVNIYGTAMLRFPLAYENFNLRTSASFGTSILLTDLYGAPSGSVGLYAGLNFLGLEWKLSRRFYMIVSPLQIVIPVPQLTGVPLAYPQYRFTLGFEAYFG